MASTILVRAPLTPAVLSMANTTTTPLFRSVTSSAPALGKLDEKLRRLSVQATRPGDIHSQAKTHSGEKTAEDAVVAASAAVTPAGQRIAEYEQALTPSTSKRGHGTLPDAGLFPGFPSQGRQLVDFPNEILTHIFSYLQPGSHAAVALVSKRFYSLITTPHAWRMAFRRYFPGQEPGSHSDTSNSPVVLEDVAKSEAPLFSRLTSLASWRSEYLLRTRLLRSIASGKPGAIIGANGESVGAVRPGGGVKKATAVITYSSQLPWMVNRLHAVFSSTGKKSARVVHGASDLGVATASNPAIGKLESWGARESFAAAQLDEIFPQLTPYGLHDGPAAVPNVMDISQLYGSIIGEGFPGGRPLYRAMGSHGFSYLENHARTRSTAQDQDIPNISEDSEAVSAVWVAKSAAVPAVTRSMIAMLAGTTLGVVSAYSLAKADSGSRYAHNQVTARWVLCPGIPIIAIQADDSFSEKRRAMGRVWAVALNALGEVYYLQDVPTPAASPAPALGQRLSDVHEKLAWQAGRTARWELVELTRRSPTSDWFDAKNASLVLAASPSPPRSSSNSMKLSQEQLVAEAREIEKFIDLTPATYRSVYDDGWDMRRKLEVDFSGGRSGYSTEADGNAGESVFVISCGIEPNGRPATVTRFTRFATSATTQAPSPAFPASPVRSELQPTPSHVFSVFGSGLNTPAPQEPRVLVVPRVQAAADGRSTPTAGWQSTELSFKTGNNNMHTEITCTAVDLSVFSLSAPFEDPLVQQMDGKLDSAYSGEIPGRRARWIAIGTKTGAVFVWNMRETSSLSSSEAAAAVPSVRPLRVIQTESPEVSSLAVSSLFLVHGGSDGLVQAWDPLASTVEPIRTLNSRSQGRVPRHLAHTRPEFSRASFSVVRAIFLDPDPTALRGVLAVGTLLRYWSYSSNSFGSSRKRLRRVRHATADGQLVSRRLGVRENGYIAAETAELRREQEDDSRHRSWMCNRFGVGLADLTEEEAVRYAEIMSQETLLDEQVRSSGFSGPDSANGSSADQASLTSSISSSAAETLTPAASLSEQQSPPSATSPSVLAASSASATFVTDDGFELQIQRAIRLSLMEGVNDDSNGEFSVTYRPAKQREDKGKGKMQAQVWEPAVATTSSSWPDAGSSTAVDGGSGGNEDDDFRLALALSLQDEEQRQLLLQEQEENDAVLAATLYQEEEFPALEVRGKGKGKGKHV
ncbi:f-box and wd domain containing protein [Grosmannia clavigera kw1407]|uniref:F-box and wd domain containing protein n=1 Tax=Grosmannia clavigera (strain kw1407 / UAMH 11150) TaxID=655863 RepID=F0XGP4_GROCL|nr:f-box and wd domain containing protein [Grosmannia clavigera kw1407]EFX02703.1 f-box and wd domain containing protein [Grosmannia clavigera kw1407]